MVDLQCLWEDEGELIDSDFLRASFPDALASCVIIIVIVMGICEYI